MARYIGSPLGIIRGSIGDLTFIYLKGRKIVYLKPSRKKEMDVKHENARLVFCLNIRLYNMLKSILSKYRLTKNSCPNKYSLFLKQNSGTLYNSIPDRVKPCNNENWLDLTFLQLTCNGKLYEPKMKPELIPLADSKLKIKWDTNTYKEGAPEDIANILLLYCKPVPTAKKIQIENAVDSLFLVAGTTLTESLNFLVKNPQKYPMEIKAFYFRAKRKDSELIMNINSELNPNFLTALLFFSNEKTYSDTNGASITTVNSK